MKSLLLNGFTEWKAAGDLRTEKVMLRSAFSLSPTHLSWGSKVGWCTASAGAQHKPLCCTHRWHLVMCFSPNPQGHSQESAHLREGSSRIWFVPGVRGHHMQMKCWVAQLVETGPEGEPLLCLEETFLGWLESSFWSPTQIFHWVWMYKKVWYILQIICKVCILISPIAVLGYHTAKTANQQLKW